MRMGAKVTTNIQFQSINFDREKIKRHQFYQNVEKSQVLFLDQDDRPHRGPFFLQCGYVSMSGEMETEVYSRKQDKNFVIILNFQHRKKKMNTDQSEKPILIYYNIRGNAQIIRSVLLEIGVEFDEIFVTKEGYLHPDIIQKYGIQMEKLPYLVHKGHAITDVFPIIKYLCIYFNRGDLLGKTVDDSIKIAEILVKYSKERNNILSTLMQGLREIHEKKLNSSALLKLAGVLASIVAKNKYCQATERMFIKTGHFLCGYLTILDFIYYQKCFYFVNMLTVNFPPKGEITKGYVNFYEQTAFFQKNSKFLNQYQIFMQEMDSDMNDLMHKMWIGDRKFLGDECKMEVEY